MAQDAHHNEALLETAKQELDRAHHAALSMSAGEIRRGLDLALAALRDMADTGPPPADIRHTCAGKVEQALTDLDAGALSKVGSLIEDVRKRLEAL